ncbi:MAG: ABC transporter ATP-binding protein [Planctomycetota bacterium]|nr:ABC transporter ATP-binding protein [Planctomycetota bacterium]
MAETTLLIENLAHRYEAAAWSLAVPSFALSSGMFVGLIGPNGSGKSTLLKAAAGVLHPAAGEVKINGAPLREMERRSLARCLGYLPQETASLFDYTVEEVATMGRYPHASSFGGLTARDRAAVERCLALTEMLPLRRRRLSQLSGGERKRAFLASVLAQEPALMLLDEPTAALDLHHQVRFFRLARSLAEAGIGIAIATHDVNLAAMFCDRLVLMQAGRFLGAGEPKQVLQENVLRQVYGQEIVVASHPEDGSPLLLPRRCAEGRL